MCALTASTGFIIDLVLSFNINISDVKCTDVCDFIHQSNLLLHCSCMPLPTSEVVVYSNLKNQSKWMFLTSKKIKSTSGCCESNIDVHSLARITNSKHHIYLVVSLHSSSHLMPGIMEALC